MSEQQNYQIKFISERKAVSSINVKAGQLVKKIPNINKEKHIFLGWLLNDEVYDFSKPINSDLELIASWKSAPNKINYKFGDVYTSKDKLFRDFFTDFYNYLIKFYPEAIEGYSLNEFLFIASDWDYGKGTLSGLGSLFGKYYLIQTTNGVVEDQQVNGFIGYCYQNNKYRSFIKFIITFFAYWRTDEDYSSMDIHGNDFFYNGWAALVDTCKFFFFNYETLFKFQRTERLLNCFVDIDNVVDISNIPLEVCNTKLPELKRRGYTFVGWFLDSEYQKKITELTENMKNVTLYPKWRKKSFMVSYLDKENNIEKVEKHDYQDYVNVDNGYIYIDVVEHSETYRELNYTKEMPIINEIIFMEKK